MSTINDKATITLEVNGQQAKKVLADLESSLDKANKKLNEMRKTGADPVAIKKQEKEVKRLTMQIDRMKTTAAQVKEVMANLDKATPRQLEKTLGVLKKQFKDLQPGTAVWDEHVAKMKRVQAQLKLVNSGVREHRSVWQKFTSFMNNGAVAIVASVAAYTAALQKLRGFVNDWATMEESIWNSVKYTRMTREEVDELNEAFKKMDTRLGREQLNALAQEAGRLGKNTVKDVQEYVEAAQIINVALVDLGDGATQTIAKLSNIFGIEQMYGVRDAMLKIGSTVNHLSQNCTASKPYLVNFAQRLAGIGATAKMTVPEILAFGAVLDANGQKVEMSASAISRLVMMLFQKTGEIAKTVGLNVNYFTKVLQDNTTNGLVMFLDQLKKISNGSEATAVAKLAPLFKDLGMDGIRMSQVIATLTQHMSELNWQFGEAKKAFKEGSSATNEFEIFNNTAQAKIEKARYRIHELSVELGEKLSPLMMHVTTTSTMLVKALNVSVDFFIKYKNTIAVVALSIGAYILQLKAAVLWEKAWSAAMAVSRGAVVASRMASVAFSGVLALMTGNIGKASKALTILNGVMKISPWGAVISLIGVATTAFMAFKDSTKAAADEQNKFKEIMNRTNTSIRSEQEEIDKAFAALRKAKKGTEEYEIAKNKIISQYSKYLKGLVNEKNELLNIEAAYMRVSIAARRSAIDRGLSEAKKGAEDTFNERNEGIMERLEKKIKQYAKSEGDVYKLIQSIRNDINNTGYVSDDLKKVIAISINKGQKENSYQAIMSIVNELEGSYQKFDNDIEELKSEFGYSENPFMEYTKDQLSIMLDDLQAQIAQAKSDRKKGTPASEYVLTIGGMDIDKFASEIEAYHKEQLIAEALQLKKAESDSIQNKDDNAEVSTSNDNASGASAKNKFEEEEKWRQMRIMKEKKYHLDSLTSEYEHQNNLIEIEEIYLKKILNRKDLTSEERLKYQVELLETQKKEQELYYGWQNMKEQDFYGALQAEVRQQYADGLIDKKHYDIEMEGLELEHLKTVISNSELYSKVYMDAEKRINEIRINQRERELRAEEEHQKDLQKIKDEVFGPNEAERQDLYKSALSLLDEVYESELSAAADNEAEKLRIVQKYEEAKLALRQKYGLEAVSVDKKNWESFDEYMKESLGEGMAKALSHGWGLVEGIMSQVSSLIQSNVDAQVKAIESRYEVEERAAQGNAYKLAKLEKEKEQRIAEAKNAANKKAFAMQILQVIASTAQNAVTAWGTGMQAGFPVGPILAPSLMGLALATGAIQLAVIRKQQQNAASTGYAEGGFTEPGPKYKPAGIVHAGEWVASQKLLANPVVRPMIDAMEYVQRTNTIGNLPRNYVDRSLSAPAFISRAYTRVNDEGKLEKFLKDATSAVKDMRRRLSQPIVPIVTITGDHGVEKAQNEIERYRNNASFK